MNKHMTALQTFYFLQWDDCLWGQLEAGQEMPKPFPVMARLEGEFVAEPAPAAPLEVNV